MEESINLDKSVKPKRNYLLYIILFVIFAFYSSTVCNKLRLTKEYTKEEAKLIFTENCSKNTCNLAYQYNGDFIYMTSYRTSKKPKLNSYETIYYNPNNIEEAFLKSELFNIFNLFLYIIIPSLLILRIILKKFFNVKFVNIASLLSAIMIIFLLFIDNIEVQLVAIFFIYIFFLVSNKMEDKRMLSIFNGFFCFIFGTLIILNNLLNKFDLIFMFIGIVLTVLSVLFLYGQYLKNNEYETGPNEAYEKNQNRIKTVLRFFAFIAKSAVLCFLLLIDLIIIVMFVLTFPYFMILIPLSMFLLITYLYIKFLKAIKSKEIDNTTK